LGVRLSFMGAFGSLQKFTRVTPRQLVLASVSTVT
jgi:hypothetical protein